MTSLPSLEGRRIIFAFGKSKKTKSIWRNLMNAFDEFFIKIGEER